MNDIIHKRIRSRKARVLRRLDKDRYPDDLSRPMLRAGPARFELAERTVGTCHGGIGLVHQFVRELGLPEAIDRRLILFKCHLPYHESDHALHMGYNALCGGRTLEDLETLRQDEAYLNILGADRVPDPTTAGDFCRRFKPADLDALQAAYDEARLKVWAQQPPDFFAEARIEADGTMVETGAECKDGIGVNHKGQWGYHPLVLTLANTGEVLRLTNRPAQAASHEGAAPRFDECVQLCRQAGFRKILLRGDTDFSQTEHLDRWHEQDVHFVFGYDARKNLLTIADELPETAWKRLNRPQKYTVQTKPRAKPQNVRQQIVEQRGFKDLRLLGETVAEFSYRPHACRHTYRMVVLRKQIRVSEPRQQVLFEDYRYFFYITNQPETHTATELVLSANDRCHQENILAQLKSFRSLHAAVDNLTSNAAYMLMTALAWNLKVWLALRLPVAPGRWQEQHQAQKKKLLHLEFRTFIQHWLQLPCQVLTTGRQLVLRLLAWNTWQPVFFRLANALRQSPRNPPLRC